MKVESISFLSTLEDIDDIFKIIIPLSREIISQNDVVNPKNDAVNQLNDICLEKFKGKTIEYLSIDTVGDLEDAFQYPTEFLNSCNSSGLPLHRLKLKIYLKNENRNVHCLKNENLFLAYPVKGFIDITNYMVDLGVTEYVFPGWHRRIFEPIADTLQ